MSGDRGAVVVESRPAAPVAAIRRPRASSVFFCATVLVVQSAWLGALGYLAFRFL